MIIPAEIFFTGALLKIVLTTVSTVVIMSCFDVNVRNKKKLDFP